MSNVGISLTLAFTHQVGIVGIVGISVGIYWSPVGIPQGQCLFVSFFLSVFCFLISSRSPPAMSNFLFWSRDSADTAAIAKALAATAAASSSSPRLHTQGPIIQELPRAREDNPNALSSRNSEVPTLNLADLRSSLPGPRPSSSVSSGGSFPSSAKCFASESD